jgi:hypothetical protein
MMPGPPPHVEIAADVSVRDLLATQTPWNGWLSLTAEGPLSWPYVVALLLRNVDIRDVIMPFTLALEKTALIVEGSCIDERRKAHNGSPISFFDWLSCWQDRPEQAVLKNMLSKLSGNYNGDAAAGLAALTDEGAWHGATMWFLTAAIAVWLSMASPTLRNSVLGEHDWIEEIAGRNPDDAIAQVYASLYQAFVARGRCQARPLDVEIVEHLAAFENSEHRILYRRVYRSHSPLDRWLEAAIEGQGDVVAMLGAGPGWPSAGANMAVSQKFGLVSPDDLTLTAHAQTAANLRQINRIARSRRGKNKDIDDD